MPEVEVRLDKSKHFSECRGDRTPDDPHYNVHYFQGGKMMINGKVQVVVLPFDAHGNLVPDDGRNAPYQGMVEGKPHTFYPLYTNEMRVYLEAKKKKMLEVQEPASAAPTLVEDEDGFDESDAVDLAAWLRGTAKYSPNLVREVAKKRYHKSYPNLNELVVDLVLDEHLVPEDEVCKPLAKHLKSLADKKVATV